MRTGSFKGVLLSALVFVSLIMPLLLISNITDCTATSESTNDSQALLSIVDGYHVILHGKDTMYQEYNVATPPPELVYSPGDNPPIMVGKQIENGRVVAFGGLGTFRGGTGYYGTRGYPDNVRWKEGEFDKLIHRVFQWLKSGATTVLWYEGHNVYHGHLVCEYFIDNMVAAPYNYTITWTEDNITSDLLGDNDILVIPQLQLGAGATGGDPTLLSDTEVEVIENFVKAGGGLLIMEGSDYATYNFYKVQNKILKKLGFLYLFQSDSLEDNVNFRQELRTTDPTPYLPVVNVDTATWVGDGYENDTLENEVGLYAVASLRKLPVHPPQWTVQPLYRSVLPGGTVTFTVEVINISDLNYDNFVLGVTDDLGWVDNADLSENELLNVENGTSRTTTLTVAVPDDKELYGVMDNITITVTSQLENRSDNKTTTVHVCTWIKPPTDDAMVSNSDPSRHYGAMYNYMHIGSSMTEYQNERVYLKFDLGEGLPNGYTIENARLYLYCFDTVGALGKNVQAYGLDNDNWSEENLTWNNQPTEVGTYLDTEGITDESRWYSWDVAPFLENYPVDNIASFLLRAENENLSSPNNFSYGFRAKEYTDKSLHPYLVFGVRPVASYITENYGLPGENVIVKAVINNRGAVVDNYGITIENTSPGWILSPSATVEINVKPNENRTVNITVTIPGNAKPGNGEKLTVTVTSQKDNKYASSTTEYGMFVEFQVNVFTGWNLVGFVEENTPNNLFPGWTYYVDYVIYHWDAPGGPYGLQGPDQVLEDNLGYWVGVFINEDRTVRERAILPDNRDIHLENGWNLVSFPVVDNTTTPNKIFAPLNSLIDYFIYYWNAPGGPYGLQGPTQVLEDNRGYWVYINQDYDVTVP